MHASAFVAVSKAGDCATSDGRGEGRPGAEEHRRDLHATRFRLGPVVAHRETGVALTAGPQVHTIYREVGLSDAEVYTVGWSRQRVRILRKWRVLDVGSGHNPHPRADVLLEKELACDAERSGKAAVRDERPMVVGDAQALPFSDQSFDYAIASNIAEHVEDPVAFCSELRRVAARGYIECPSPLGERLLGEPFHLWVVARQGDVLVFRRKPQSSGAVRRISEMFYAFYYAGRRRGRPTLQPRSALVQRALNSLRWRLAKVWHSRLIRRWTYTCVEFDGQLEARVVSR